MNDDDDVVVEKKNQVNLLEKGSGHVQLHEKTKFFLSFPTIIKGFMKGPLLEEHKAFSPFFHGNELRKIFHSIISIEECRYTI